jgi:hypothetical protein
MIYKCSKCGYETNRLLNFQRHESRKIPCKNVFSSNELLPNIECSKCLKNFSSYEHMKKHESKCDGLHVLQCKICLKMFATRQGKHQHTKYVKCVSPANNINNITINDNSTNITNITNNIRLCFGSEILDKLCNEDEYMDKMDEYIKLLKYALPKALEDVYFNEKYPNNQTIKKERKNDNMVSVHVGHNKWEKRMTNDMMGTTLETLHDYMEKYISEVQLTPLRRRRLQVFGREMAKLNFWATDSIEDKLDIDSYEEPSEETMKKEGKIVTKLLSDKIYEQTKSL